MKKKTRRHTEGYFVDKYNEIKAYADEQGIEQPYKSLNSFINDYEYMRERGVKNIMKEIRYYAKHEVSYETARAMLAKAKEFGGTEKLKDLKDMKTRVFVDKYLTQIKEAQAEAQTMFGAERDEQGRLKWVHYIGINWFGSSGE